MAYNILSVYDNPNKVVQDAYDMLTAKIHINNSQKKIKTLAITSCRSGEGKTSLSISLAISIAHSGWKVLLIDSDMRKPTASKRLNKDTQLGLSDYLARKENLNKVISETNITNLSYLACGSDCLNPVELLCSFSFQEMIEHINKQYDFVLFDTPAMESVADATIIASKVDATLLVVETGVTSLKNIKRNKEQLESLNASILGVVLNKMKKTEYKRYFSSYNYFNKLLSLRKRKKKNIPVYENTHENTINL